MKKIFLLFSLLLLTGFLVMAQTSLIIRYGHEVLMTDQNCRACFVTVKGTTLGTITGPDGKFSIQAPTNARTLVFSFVGYVTQEQTIDGRNRIDIVLKQDLFNVDEVVVVAYGTAQRRDIAGAVSTVKGGEVHIAKMTCKALTRLCRQGFRGLQYAFQTVCLTTRPSSASGVSTRSHQARTRL
ncbi:MAG: carboxypeptidase-like regulatory domain-containing protein [Bacteroidales bacterium]|nr:carboxypeptidase-like regulatory domain-containing protein [Bacteroidales bacterium]